MKLLESKFQHFTWSLLLFLLFSASSAASQSIPISVSVIKGPTGIASAWMIADPPKTSTHHVRFMLSPSADLVITKLISGEVSAGVLPVNVAAKLYNAGIKIRAIAVVGNGMVKLLSQKSSITSLSDLKGKVVHIAGQKATPDFLFRYLMERANLVAGRDYTAVYSLAYPEIAAQLAAGTIEYAVIPEPFATQARMINPSLNSPVDLGSVWQEATGQISYPMSIFVASESLIRQAPQLLDEIVRIYKTSILKTNTEPETTAVLAESLDLGIKATVAKNSIPVSAYDFILAEEAKPSIERILKVFLEFETQSIGGRLPSTDFYFSYR